MSDESKDEKDSGKDIKPVSVKVVNAEVRKLSPYDGHDDDEYEELGITEEGIEEFESDDFQNASKDY